MTSPVWKLVQEHDDHFVINDGEADFPVAKAGLDDETMARIRECGMEGRAKGSGEPEHAPEFSAWDAIANTVVPSAKAAVPVTTLPVAPGVGTPDGPAFDLGGNAPGEPSFGWPGTEGTPPAAEPANPDRESRVDQALKMAMSDPAMSGADDSALMEYANRVADGGFDAFSSPPEARASVMAGHHDDGGMSVAEQAAAKRKAQDRPGFVGAAPALVGPPAPTPEQAAQEYPPPAPVATTTSKSVRIQHQGGGSPPATATSAVEAPPQPEPPADTDAMRARQAQADAEAQAVDLKAQHADMLAKSLKTLQTQHEQAFRENQARADAAHQAILAGRMDPQRMFHDMSTGNRFAVAIGLFMGAGANGRNGAAEVLERAIDRDLHAQEMDLGRQRTGLEFYIQRGHDLEQAFKLRKADMLDVAAAQLQAAVGKYDIPRVQAEAATAIQAMRSDAYKLRLATQKEAFDQKAETAKIRSDDEYKKAMAAVARGNLALDRQKLEMAQKASEQQQRLGGMTEGDALKMRIWDEINKGPIKGENASVFAGRIREMAARARLSTVDLPDGSIGLAFSQPSAEKVRTFTALYAPVRKKVADLRAFIASHPQGGVPGWDGDDRSKAKSVFNGLLQDINNMGGFGQALTGSEREIMTEQIGDVFAKLSAGSWKEARLDALEDSLDSKLDGLLRTSVIGYGRKR